MMRLPKERSGDGDKFEKISDAKTLKSNQAIRVAREGIAHAICS